MTKRQDNTMVPLNEIRHRRATDEQAVERLRDEILAESRANRLADLRKQTGLTQEELAERIGVDQPRVSRMERGDLSRTEVGSLAAYAEAMGGTLELVVYVEGRAFPLPVGAPRVRARKAKQSVTSKAKPAKRAAAKRTPKAS
ncbi:MAG: XRE family transcriptional regulator [Candidatus Nanopelagicales bacterium]